MKSVAGAFVLAIHFPTATIAQDVVTITQRINTGTCTPSYSFSGGVGGAGAISSANSSAGGVTVHTITNSDGSLSIITEATSGLQYAPFTTTDASGNTYVGSSLVPASVTSAGGAGGVAGSSGGSVQGVPTAGSSAVFTPRSVPNAGSTSFASGPLPIQTTAPGGLPPPASLTTLGDNATLFAVFPKGIDFPGADIPTSGRLRRLRKRLDGANSVEDCLVACANYQPQADVVGGASCVAASWDGLPDGNCYLKYAIVALNVDGGNFEAGKVASYVPPLKVAIVSFAPGDVYGSAIVSAIAASDSAIIASSDSAAAAASTEVTLSSTAAFGSDTAIVIGTETAPPSPPTDTAAASETPEGSAAFPSATEPPSSPSTTENPSAPTTTEMTLSCPNNNGNQYSDPSSQFSFYISCNTNYPGNDLTNSTVDSFELCINVCATWVADPVSGDSCVAVVYAEGTCSLKYAITEIVENAAGFEAAYLSNYTPEEVPTTTTGAAATSSPNIGPPDTVVPTEVGPTNTAEPTVVGTIDTVEPTVVGPTEVEPTFTTQPTEVAPTTIAQTVEVVPTATAQPTEMEPTNIGPATPSGAPSALVSSIPASSIPGMSTIGSSPHVASTQAASTQASTQGAVTQGASTHASSNSGSPTLGSTTAAFTKPTGDFIIQFTPFARSQ